MDIIKNLLYHEIFSSWTNILDYWSRYLNCSVIQLNKCTVTTVQCLSIHIEFLNKIVFLNQIASYVLVADRTPGFLNCVFICKVCVCMCLSVCLSICLSVCVCVYVCVCVCVCVCLSVCLSVWQCMYTCLCACVCVSVCVSLCVCLPIYVCLCVCLCLCPCVSVCVSICAFVYGCGCALVLF